MIRRVKVTSEKKVDTEQPEIRRMLGKNKFWKPEERENLKERAVQQCLMLQRSLE